MVVIDTLMSDSSEQVGGGQRSAIRYDDGRKISDPCAGILKANTADGDNGHGG